MSPVGPKFSVDTVGARIKMAMTVRGSIMPAQVILVVANGRSQCFHAGVEAETQYSQSQ